MLLLSLGNKYRSFLETTCYILRFICNTDYLLVLLKPMSMYFLLMHQMANNILYSLVVSKETGKEVESVVPAVWVKNNKVYYTNGLQVKKLHKSCTTPKDDWHQYELIKIKSTSGFTIPGCPLFILFSFFSFFFFFFFFYFFHGTSFFFIFDRNFLFFSSFFDHNVTILYFANRNTLSIFQCTYCLGVCTRKRSIYLQDY